MLEDKYSKEVQKEEYMQQQMRKRGALKQLSNEEGYETFVVPDNVGGRFTVLTAVGLLPIAAAGLDIDGLIGRSKRCYGWFSKPFDENQALQYAVVRNIYIEKEKILKY